MHRQLYYSSKPHRSSVYKPRTGSFKVINKLNSHQQSSLASEILKKNFNLWDFPINTSNKILSNHLLTTPIMAKIAENIDNEYVLTAIIAVRENNKRSDSKSIRDYINKNFAADVEEELIESIIIKLLDHNIIENRPTPKGNSYFIRKKNNTPIDVISADRTLQINECELVSDTDQQFNEITLKSQSTPVIESTPNKLSHTEDTSNRYNNSKSQFKQSEINNSTISKPENYVDQKFDEAAMKHLKENILSNIKYRFSDVAKAKECSQSLIDSLEYQINSLQNETRFLREELKVKNSDITNNNAL